MTKEKKMYYFLVVAFILFISVLVSVFLIKNINFEGQTIIKRKYYEIIYTSNNENVSIRDDIINIKLNDIDDKISFDILNAGNIDAIIKNVNINIVNTNLNKDSLKVKTNLNNGDYIKGGETKRTYIAIDYDSVLEENSYLEINLKYTFGE